MWKPGVEGENMLRVGEAGDDGCDEPELAVLLSLPRFFGVGGGRGGGGVTANDEEKKACVLDPVGDEETALAACISGSVVDDCGRLEEGGVEGGGGWTGAVCLRRGREKRESI